MTKYRAQPTVVEGIRFASKAEGQRYKDLLLLEKAGEISGLVLQVRYPLVVNGMLVATYISDFNYTLTATGEQVTEDVKGFRTPIYKLKAKLMKAIHGITILET